MGTTVGRLVAAGGISAVLLVVGAGPAAAVLTENSAGCQGSAVVTDEEGGGSTTVTADDAEVTLPASGSARREGSVSPGTTDHFGEIVLETVLGDVTLGEWGPSPNKNPDGSPRETSKSGVEDLPEIPPGKYKVSGFHQGAKGGRCAGFVTVTVEGNPLTNPVGAGVAGATVLTGLGLAAAALAKPGGAA